MEDNKNDLPGDQVAKVVVRSGIPEDRDFIFNSWINGQYWSSNYWKAMPEQLFRDNFSKIILKTLANPACTVKVAVMSDAPQTILSFSVSHNDSLFWCYTKKDYRGSGLLNLLLSTLSIKTVASTTLAGASIAKKKKFVFNPFLLEFK